MAYDSQVNDHRFPTTDSIAGAARAGAHAGQALAEGKVPGFTDANANNNNFGEVPGVDTDTLTWGRSGEVTAHTEVPVQPSGAAPVRSGGAAGNWNAAQIFNNSKVGS
jgi:hypothetical protein